MFKSVVEYFMICIKTNKIIISYFFISVSLIIFTREKDYFKDYNINRTLLKYLIITFIRIVTLTLFYIKVTVFI